jgi:hypothetical protein
MTSFNVIIVNKNGTLSTSILDNMENIYKKAGLKSSDGFLKHCDWEISIEEYPKLFIQVYGKIKGKADNENKYEFPPPINNHLFFGKCVIVGFIKNKTENQYISLSLDLWKKIYNKLYSFEDLGTEDTDEDMDEMGDETESSDEEDTPMEVNDGFELTEESYLLEDTLLDEM